MAGLTKPRHTAVIAYQERPPCLFIIGIHPVLGSLPVIDALVVMEEYGRNIYPIRTWHAILAICAWYVLTVYHPFGNIIQKLPFFVTQRNKWRECS